MSSCLPPSLFFFAYPEENVIFTKNLPIPQNPLYSPSALGLVHREQAAAAPAAAGRLGYRVRLGAS